MRIKSRIVVVYYIRLFIQGSLKSTSVSAAEYSSVFISQRLPTQKLSIISSPTSLTSNGKLAIFGEDCFNSTTQMSFFLLHFWRNHALHLIRPPPVRSGTLSQKRSTASQLILIQDVCPMLFHHPPSGLNKPTSLEQRLGMDLSTMWEMWVGWSKQIISS